MTPRDPAAPHDSPEVLARFRAEIGLVDLNAKQLGRRIGGGAVTLDDLRSFGHEGLLQAARTFDEARGVPFRRWANLRIRGAMIDGVRRFGSLPRRIYRELDGALAGDRLQELYDEEDAAAPSPSPAVADSRLSSYLAGLATAIALGTVASDSGRGDGEATNAQAPTPEDLVELAELARHVRSVVARLPDQERALIEQHYFADETLERAAASIGLSKSWGSRLHTRAIEHLSQEFRKMR